VSARLGPDAEAFRRPLAGGADVNDTIRRARLVDPATLALELGVSRDWVYEHSAELGALRLGNGPKPRLRFDPVAVRDALSPKSGDEPAVPPRATGRRAAPSAAPKLPVRPRRSQAL